MSCLWKQFPEEMLFKNIYKKNSVYFLVSSSRLKKFKHILQNPKPEQMKN